MSRKDKSILGIISVNLLVGNSILILGGLSSFGGNPNYNLVWGLSIACIAVYLFLFRRVDIEKLSYLKSAILFVLCSILIIFWGNTIALCIFNPKELFLNFFTAIVMGVGANILFFPITLSISILNLFWIKYLKND